MPEPTTCARCGMTDNQPKTGGRHYDEVCCIIALGAAVRELQERPRSIYRNRPSLDPDRLDSKGRLKEDPERFLVVDSVPGQPADGVTGGSMEYLQSLTSPPPEPRCKRCGFPEGEHTAVWNHHDPDGPAEALVCPTATFEPQPEGGEATEPGTNAAESHRPDVSPGASAGSNVGAPDRDNTKVMQDDVAELLRVLGLSDYARPVSPHRVVQDEIIPAIKFLRDLMHARRMAAQDAFEPLANVAWDENVPSRVREMARDWLDNHGPGRTNVRGYAQHVAPEDAPAPPATERERDELAKLGGLVLERAFGDAKLGRCPNCDYHPVPVSSVPYPDTLEAWADWLNEDDMMAGIQLHALYHPADLLREVAIYIRAHRAATQGDSDG